MRALRSAGLAAAGLLATGLCAAQRGRGDGEVMALLREGLAGAARTRHVEEIRGEFIAIDTALDRLQPGDLCLVLVDQVEEALAHLARRCAEAGVAA